MTTVQSEQYIVGRVAVEEMIKIIGLSWEDQEMRSPAPIMLTPTLIVRQSSLKHKVSEKGGDTNYFGDRLHEVPAK